jgi:hypothetical protein
MRVGDFSSSLSRLATAAEALERSWETTREQWDDPSSRGFEETHLRELFSQVTSVMQATSRFREVAQRAVRECQPPGESER